MKHSKGKRPSIGSRRPKKGPKPAPPSSLKAAVPRKLGDKELYYGARRLVTKVQLVKSLKTRKASQNQTINAEIKAAEAEVDALVEQLATGVEMVEKGDLFAGEQPGAAKEPEDKTPTQDQATKALAAVAQEVTPAARFIAHLGERNGMSDREIKSRLWQWCSGEGIRSHAERAALLLAVEDLIKPPADAHATTAPASDTPGPQATA